MNLGYLLMSSLRKENRADHEESRRVINGLVRIFVAPIFQVHFVDADHEVLDAQQRCDEAIVPMGLFGAQILSSIKMMEPSRRSMRRSPCWGVLHAWLVRAYQRFELRRGWRSEERYATSIQL